MDYPDCFFLLPDGVSYHGHAVSGGKKTGSGPLALKRELRELTGEVQVKNRAVEETAAALERLDREIAGLQRRSGSAARPAAEPGKGRAGAGSRASQAGRGVRAVVSRDCRWRAWNWSGLRQEGSRARAQQEQDQRLLEEKEAARSVEEQVLEQSRADLEELQSEAHWPGGRTRERCARNWPDSKSGAAPRRRRRRGYRGADSADRARAGRRLAAEMERLGRRAGAPAGGQHRTGSPGGRTGRRDSGGRRDRRASWPRRRPRCARILRRWKKRSSSCAWMCRRRRRSARKSSWSWCRSRPS